MKKLLLTISLLSLLLIAGCGSSATNDQDKPNNDTSNQSENSESSNPSKDSDNGSSKSNEQTDENTNFNTEQNNEEPADDHTDQTAPNVDQPLTYTLSGKSITETAKLVNSDNQEFSMNVLPKFELTGEEPRKDLLYKKDANQVSMRIELLSTEDTNWSQLEENIPTELSSVSNNITQPTDASLQIDQATVYEATNGTDIVTIYLIKNDKKPMKLTIFSTVTEDYRTAFVEMAKTIK